ncbi:MAG: hypothetical protein MI922_18230, partial [Bacteroidales bacterium]|nr:hypothetical protein [Bacteroidales bacterium]
MKINIINRFKIPTIFFLLVLNVTLLPHGQSAAIFNDTAQLYSSIDSLHFILLEKKLQDKARIKIFMEIAHNHFRLYNFHFANKQIHEAYFHLSEAGVLIDTMEESLTKAYLLNRLSILYTRTGNFDASIVEANKLKEVGSKIKSHKHIATAEIHLTLAHGILRNPGQELRHGKTALKQAFLSGDSAVIARACYRLAHAHINSTQDIDSALYYIQQSHNYNAPTHAILNIYSEIQMVNGKLDLADSLLTIAIPAILKSKEIPLGPYHYSRLAQLKKIQKKYNEAIEIATKGYNLSLENFHLHAAISNLRLLTAIYDSINNADQALYYMHQLRELEDSLHSDSRRQSYAWYKQKEDEQQAIISEQLLEQQKLQIANKNLLFFGALFGLFLLILLILVMLKAYHRKQKDHKLISLQKEKVDHAYSKISAKNKEILDSINYAKRIQETILPSDEIVNKYLKDSFILFKPKDIVAGDFYWLEHRRNKTLFAACDCTGHGVPGALVSVVCNSVLNRCVREYSLTDPGSILIKTREIVLQEFEKSDKEVTDGMDIALCSIRN